jgi:integrase
LHILENTCLIYSQENCTSPQLRYLYPIIDATGDRAGVALTPHMFHRTWITEWLATGGNLRDAQVQAGHSNESTTLLYAIAGDAESRRKQARFRY